MQPKRFWQENLNIWSNHLPNRQRILLFYIIGRTPNHRRSYSNLSFLSLGLITKVQYP